eukprot:GHVH01002118.1.p1 GENE.GHVH01002118.1~~GHVH01002118.1.p1  ORF type:complete len:808 (+),score=148.68 GHVH01002118.1:545-2968(+)
MAVSPPASSEDSEDSDFTPPRAPLKSTWSSFLTPLVDTLSPFSPVTESLQSPPAAPRLDSATVCIDYPSDESLLGEASDSSSYHNSPSRTMIDLLPNSNVWSTTASPSPLSRPSHRVDLLQAEESCDSRASSADEAQIVREITCLSGPLLVRSLESDDGRVKYSKDSLPNESDQWAEILANVDYSSDNEESDQDDLYGEAFIYFNQCMSSDASPPPILDLRMKPLVKRYYEQAIDDAVARTLDSILTEEEESLVDSSAVPSSPIYPWDEPTVDHPILSRADLWNSFDNHPILKTSPIFISSLKASRKLLRMSSTLTALQRSLPLGISPGVVPNVNEILTSICECIISLPSGALAFGDGFHRPSCRITLLDSLSPLQALMMRSNTKSFLLPSKATKLAVWHDCGFLVDAKADTISPLSWHRGDNLCHSNAISLGGVVDWVVPTDSGVAGIGLRVDGGGGEVVMLCNDGVIAGRYTGFRNIPVPIVVTSQMILLSDGDDVKGIMSLEGRSRVTRLISLDEGCSIVPAVCLSRSDHVVIRAKSAYGVAWLPDEASSNPKLETLYYFDCLLEGQVSGPPPNVCQMSVLRHGRAVEDLEILVGTTDRRFYVFKSGKAHAILTEWSIASVDQIRILPTNDSSRSLFSLLITAAAPNAAHNSSLLVEISSRRDVVPSPSGLYRGPDPPDGGHLVVRVIHSFDELAPVALLGPRSPLERYTVVLADRASMHLAVVVVPSWRAVRTEARSASRALPEVLHPLCSRVEEGLWRLLLPFEEAPVADAELVAIDVGGIDCGNGIPRTFDSISVYCGALP